MITKEMIEKDLNAVREKIGKIPNKNEYDKYGEYGKTTIGRRYGTWTNALIEIFPDYKEPEKSQELKCSYCEKNIVVVPSNIKEKNYCSVSCSNKEKPRRKKQPCHKCETCNNYATRRDTKYCKECHIRQNCSFHLTTMKELREKRKDATRYSQVRAHARLIMDKSDIERKCKNCQYSKHVQVCHIKDICDFFDIDTVGKVNSVDNLVYLCPNCHWEFDHNLLKL